MKVDRIVGPGFGIYRKHKSVSVGDTRIDTIKGKVGDNKITVYTQYEKGEKTGKLFYVEDKFWNFLKFKVQKYKGGKLVNQLIKTKDK